VPAGGARQPSSLATKEMRRNEAGGRRCDENLFMDGAEIFNFSIDIEPRAVREILDYAAVGLEAIDYFVFHQANRYILSSIAKRLKVDSSKVPMETVEKYGNQSSASIPCALSGELADVLRVGPSQRVVLSGFGVGLSWASAVLTLPALAVCEIVECE